MSSSFGYLIPNRTFEVGQFKKLITSALGAQGIIDGYYDEEHQWFAAGDNSHSFFSESNDYTNPAFEYVEIHDTDNYRIIPDCTEDNYGAKCSNCRAYLDESLSDKLMDLSDIEAGSGIETDMTQLSLQCHNCGQTNKISDLNYDLAVRFKKQFACFVEIDSEFAKEKVSEVSNKLECTFEVIYGSF